MDKMTLEELLNKLIEKGWKPFGKEKKELKFVDIGKEMLLGWKEDYYCSKGYNYRELTSLESGLWQYVCENNLQKQLYPRWENGNSVTEKNYIFDCDDVTYRLIESALCDEDKLEEFLLSNIKIDE